MSPEESSLTLEAQKLDKSYRGRRVVSDVSLTISSGEVVGLLGPNGAGKTTTFYMIVGLTTPGQRQRTLEWPGDYLPAYVLAGQTRNQLSPPGTLCISETLRGG